MRDEESKRGRSIRREGATTSLGSLGWALCARSLRPNGERVHADAQNSCAWPNNSHTSERTVSVCFCVLLCFCACVRLQNED